nr:hypothetical protein [Tanacetum cinerariifolium]
MYVVVCERENDVSQMAIELVCGGLFRKPVIIVIVAYVCSILGSFDGSSEVLISGRGCVFGSFSNSAFRTDSFGIFLGELPSSVSLSFRGFSILGSSVGNWMFVGDDGGVLSYRGATVCSGLIGCCGVSVGMGACSARVGFRKTWSRIKSSFVCSHSVKMELESVGSTFEFFQGWWQCVRVLVWSTHSLSCQALKLDCSHVPISLVGLPEGVLPKGSGFWSFLFPSLVPVEGESNSVTNADVVGKVEMVLWEISVWNFLHLKKPAKKSVTRVGNVRSNGSVGSQLNPEKRDRFPFVLSDGINAGRRFYYPVRKISLVLKLLLPFEDKRYVWIFHEVALQSCTITKSTYNVNVSKKHYRVSRSVFIIVALIMPTVSFRGQTMAFSCRSLTVRSLEDREVSSLQFMQWYKTEEGPLLELQFSLVDNSKLNVVYLLNRS